MAGAIAPGMGIRTRGISYRTATIGFRVRNPWDSNDRGFITVGHVFGRGSDVLSRQIFTGRFLGVTEISHVHRSPQSGGGPFDFAFVNTTRGEGFTTSNTLPNGQTLLTSTVNPVRNTRVSMAGATTGGVQTGIVYYVGGFMPTPCGNYQVNGVTLVENVLSLGGDSGGIVFTTDGRQTAGIVIGGGRYGSQVLMAFLPARTILNVIDHERY